MRNPDLWHKLAAFRFDAEAGSQPYSVKLAEAEGWDASFTERVIEEYRRFLYLTQVSEAEVTPSVAVDRAWHMHLTFTRSYWDDLCGSVLGEKLHHDPCAGFEEMPRYGRQYDVTRKLYEEEFGAAPPEDIWPDGAPVAVMTPARRRAMWLGFGLGFPLTIFSFFALVFSGASVVAVVGLLAGLLFIAIGVIAIPPAKGSGEGGPPAVFGIGGCGTSSKGSGDGGAGGDGGGAGGCGGGGGG